MLVLNHPLSLLPHATPFAPCRQKRTRAAEEMKQKLKSPNFMLSPTRLSLRNLPYDVDEAQLKALVVAAVKERASKERPRVLSVKVLRENDRVGGDGKARSKVRGRCRGTGKLVGEDEGFCNMGWLVGWTGALLLSSSSLTSTSLSRPVRAWALSSWGTRATP